VRAQIVPERPSKAAAHANKHTNKRTGQRVSGRAQARAPGLDGVRALAVLSVLVFHEQFAAFLAGFSGLMSSLSSVDT